VKLLEAEHDATCAVLGEQADLAQGELGRVVGATECARLEVVAVELPEHQAPACLLVRAQCGGTGDENGDLQAINDLTASVAPSQMPTR
jgi:hypothetical protein